MQAECIRRAGGFKKLANSEGKKPVLLFWDGFQWVAKTGASSALLSDPRMVNSTRKLRRLYFGNLPLHLGLTEANFQQQIFEEMRRRGLCSDPNENPVLCVWFAKDKGNYGFVEFASVEETERALTMDGMETMGVTIKISRPNDYCSATNQSGALPTQMVPPNLLPKTSAAGVNQIIGQIADSRLVLMKRMVLENDVEDGPEEYLEVLDDIVEGCAGCGKVIGAALVTPDIGAQDHTVDTGDVYVLFSHAQEADKCYQTMSQRQYFGRPIRVQKIASEVWFNRISKLPNAKHMS
ncbi:putative splicing factor [Gregarina niphandrodes]|uniref:Splicing factor n=1 Tax=Gregarina niphandrodes TaxID=110365 RepID=A0A023B498_GRENI|nr:putative splicing factor [Gregarina niphandrodes]EZG56477.1 putative splicing factor [Gregarina niphandrodes]|eukprot:XP_011131252.1 putative splicing factor [Gregarina niphandrodes]